MEEYLSASSDHGLMLWMVLFTPYHRCLVQDLNLVKKKDLKKWGERGEKIEKGIHERKKTCRFITNKASILFGAWDRTRTDTVLSTEGF